VCCAVVSLGILHAHFPATCPGPLPSFASCEVSLFPFFYDFFSFTVQYVSMLSAKEKIDRVFFFFFGWSWAVPPDLPRVVTSDLAEVFHRKAQRSDQQMTSS